MASASNLQSEIRDLQEQVLQLRDVISREGGKTASALGEKTAVAINGASRRAREAADYTRAEAGSMAGVFRDHPAASSGALLTAGIIGGLIGYMLSTGGERRHDSARHWFG